MVPDFESFMLPFLQYLADGKDHSLRECVDQMGKHFHLNEDDMAELVPSGVESKVKNRTNWAMTYLKKAGLTGSEKRGVYHITKAGKDFLNTKPDKITTKLLSSLSSNFRQFSVGSGKTVEKHKDNHQEPTDDISTPEDKIESSFQILNTKLAEDLLDKVLEQTPKFFERLVVELMEKMGYGVGKVTRYTKDGGIDGIINEDKLGLDRIYIQAKRYQKESKISNGTINSFLGAVSRHGGKKGVFITTSDFTDDAKTVGTESKNPAIALINGIKLAELMIQYNLGVSTTKTYELKKVDSDYFDM